MARPHRYRDGWRVVHSITRPDGTRHRPAVYVRDPGHTRAGYRRAEIAGAELLAQHLDPDAPPPPDPGTVADLLDQWLRARRPRLKPKTVDVYEAAIARIKPRIGNDRADRIKPGHLEDMYSELEQFGSVSGGPLSSNTVKHCHVVLSAAYNWAVRREDLDRNPAELAVPPAAKTREVAPPEPAAVAEIFDLVDGVWQSALLRLAFTLGSRRGELLGLRWSDVDLETATVRRSRSVTVSSQGVGIAEETKTGRTPPPVSMDVDTVAAVRRLMNAQRELALAAGVPLVDDPWLFASSRFPSAGRVLSPEAVKTWWRRFRLDHRQFAGVQFDDLRDFVATHMLAAGVPLTVVAARLGHADPSTTARVYAKFLPASDQAAADAFAEMIRQAGRV